MIKNVTYISVWDGGTEICSSAKFDTETKLVFDIETVDGVDDDGEEVDILDTECIEFEDGSRLNEGEFTIEN